jgi:hypothetical protein
MVCFCDIPLSLVYSHMEQYGHYGIGMKQEWGQANGLNPVLYVTSRSRLAGVFNDLLDEIIKTIAKRRGQQFVIPQIEDWRDSLFRMFRFIKSLQEVGRISAESTPKKYYNEREWRYVPELPQGAIAWLMIPEEDFKEPLISQENEKVLAAKLGFEPKDINYIIIENESERANVIDEIYRIRPRKLSSKRARAWYDHHIFPSNRKRLLVSCKVARQRHNKSLQLSALVQTVERKCSSSKCRMIG